MKGLTCPYCLRDDQPFERIVDEGIAFTRCNNPECGKTVPPEFTKDAARYPTVIFSLVGLSGHGKTCYLASLIHEFQHVGANWRDFSYSAVDENSMSEVQAKLQALQEGLLPDPTFAIFPEPAILRMEGIPQIGNLQVFIFDNGGEVFTDVTRLREFGSYLTRSRVVVWLVSLQNLTQPAELQKLLRDYNEAIQSLDSDPSAQSLVVVLTKADALLDVLDEETVAESLRAVLNEEHPPAEGYDADHLDQLSRDVEHWLEEAAGQYNFVRRARRMFADVRYCVVSALGSNPEGQQLGIRVSPRGVLVPLYWLARLQLPQVLVKAAGATRSYSALDQAIADAPSGARIELGAGTHILSRPLEIRKPLTLIGAGPERTTVVGQGNKFVIGADVPGRLQIEGVAFEYQGKDWANVMLVSAVELQLQNCCFRGARLARGMVGHQAAYKGGIGLKVLRRTRGTVRACEITDNGYHGALLDDQVRLTLEANRISRNGRSGLCFAGNADGEALGNRLSKNGRDGISVTQNAAPGLLKNECDDNGQNGISILNHASPGLAGNRCRCNKVGIVIGDDASGQVNSNECADNQEDGVAVRDRAAPLLEGNRAERNAGSGLAYHGQASGEARINECRANGSNGITLTDHAAPALAGNQCENNGASGIVFRGETAGTAEGNVCTGNLQHGIDVTDDAHPLLKANRCNDNQGIGLIYRERARGEARENRIAGNRRGGLDVSEAAVPLLTDNDIAGNQQAEPETLVVLEEVATHRKKAWSPFLFRQAKS